MTVTDVIGAGADSESLDRIIKTLNGEAVYNLEHFTQLIVEAMGKARKLKDIPKTFKPKYEAAYFNAYDNKEDEDDDDDDEMVPKSDSYKYCSKSGGCF